MIDKNIPMPDHKWSNRGTTDKMRLLEIGDSFLVDAVERRGIFTRARLIGIKCVTRKEGDLFRVWRKA